MAQIKIALAGNPNCGKTTLFNALTGANQYVGNWPGVTVEKKDGRLKDDKDIIVQDLPGIYSLSPYTLEEVVARSYLVGEKPDAILNIVDGTNIERNLYLTTQLIELGIPVVVAVNMIDLVRKNGDQIDLNKLGAALGCRVFVGAGSQAEYGRVEGMLEPATPANPENGYGMAKLCAGLMSRTEAAALGMDHVWARVLSVYGPHDGPATMISGTIRALLAGQCPPLTQGEQKWDYLYSADAAEAFYRMARSGQNGAVYPLGSGQARPLREYILALRDAIDPALPL